jgi:cation:H+ antiporter
MLGIWLQFAACVVLIGFAGSRLSRYGDVIAEKTGLSGTWVGVIMLASVTSLPELTTGISSVTLADSPDIAVGDVLGSCVFNLMIIVILDFLHRHESIYTRASTGHILSAGFGILLIGFTGFSLVLSERGAVVTLGHVGIYSPIMLALYALAMRIVFQYEREHQELAAEQAAEVYADTTLTAAIAGYVAAGFVVVGAGTWLPFVGEHLAETMNWERTFVGTLFVAFATSVPEIVVTLAALRLGALNMAIGNLFGSNLFNISILAIDDLAFLRGPLLAHASPLHTISAISAIMMSGIAIIGLFYRARGRLLKTVGWTSLILLILYLLNAYLLFLYDR